MGWWARGRSSWNFLGDVSEWKQWSRDSMWGCEGGRADVRHLIRVHHTYGHNACPVTTDGCTPYRKRSHLVPSRRRLNWNFNTKGDRDSDAADSHSIWKEGVNSGAADSPGSPHAKGDVHSWADNSLIIPHTKEDAHSHAADSPGSPQAKGRCALWG
eukprot:347075-Chlamydomonas_euryale.AAC.2